MLLASDGMLLRELTGMLSRLGSMLSMSEGLLPIGMLLARMLLAEVAGMLRVLVCYLPCLVCYHYLERRYSFHKSPTADRKLDDSHVTPKSSLNILGYRGETREFDFPWFLP
jgi:hypothetical protein